MLPPLPWILPPNVVSSCQHKFIVIIPRSLPNMPFFFELLSCCTKNYHTSPKSYINITFVWFPFPSFLFLINIDIHLIIFQYGKQVLILIFCKCSWFQSRLLLLVVLCGRSIPVSVSLKVGRSLFGV